MDGFTLEIDPACGLMHAVQPSRDTCNEHISFAAEDLNG